MSTRGAPRRRARGTGREVAYETLRNRILKLALPPGSPIDEAHLVRDLKLSRTPVREALIRLASENLVDLLPNRGARVSDMPLAMMGEFFEALSLAQRATHRWAAMRRTDDDLAAIRREHRAFAATVSENPDEIPVANRAFHLAIARAGRNLFLTRTYAELLDQSLRLSRLTVIYDPPTGMTRAQHFKLVIDEHRQFIEAIERRDKDRAEQLAAGHCELMRKRVFDYFAATPIDLPELS